MSLCNMRDHMSSTYQLDRASPLPLYYQLREEIRRNIEVGRWKAGEQIPIEDDLCRMYGVSKATVRQALAVFESEGLLRRIQGKGTFVSTPRVEQGPVDLRGFTEEMRRHGMRASSRVLTRREIVPPDRVAAALGIAPEETVIMIRRLRLADAEPMGIQTTYIPQSLCPSLLSDDVTDSLYDLLEHKYRIALVRAVETHFATRIGRREATLLGVPTGSAAIAAERVTYGSGDRPVEFVNSIMRGDRYKITLALLRRK